MHCLLVVFSFHLFLISRNKITADTFDFQSIKNDHSKYDISCPNDYCEFSEVDSLETQACHCGIHCVRLGTCCFDSPYVDVPQPQPKPTCRYVDDKGFYFIVHKCPFTDSMWTGKCNDESIDDNDLQKLVPVTSHMTNITYKNFYCFRCHETGDEFSYWTLKIQHNSIPFIRPATESKELRKHISYIYYKKENSVMASYCDGIGYFPVRASLEIPSKIQDLIHVCDEGIISDCSEEWSDEEIRNKCHSYMAIKEVERVGTSPIKYKNIHCALCNYENLNGLSCKKTLCSRLDFGRGIGGYRGYRSGAGGSGGYCSEGGAYGGGAGGSGGYGSEGGGYGGGSSGGGGYGGGSSGGGGYVPINELYNINACSDDRKKCSNCKDDEYWHPFENLCEKVTCLESGFIVKNQKCVKG